MVERILISIGLIATLVLPVFNIYGRSARMGISIFMALALCLWGFYSGKIKAIKNRWLLFFLLFLLVSTWQAPKVQAVMGDMSIQNPWAWKTMFIYLVFFGMFAFISSNPFSKKDKDFILKIMVWCGFIVSLHCLAGFFGHTQWLRVIDSRVKVYLTQPHMGSVLQHPTLVSIFIAMLVPLALYLKKWLMATVMVITVCLTFSHAAIGSMVVSLLCLLGMRNKKWFISVIIILVLSSSFLIIGYNTHPKIKKFANSNGRYEIWKNIVEDLKKPFPKEDERAYSFTGFGPGSFRYLYHIQHKASRDDVRTFEAHNAYMQILSEKGKIGLIFFLLALFSYFKSVRITQENKYLLSSLICILVGAGATFALQIAPIDFYACMIAGLLINKGVQNVGHI